MIILSIDCGTKHFSWCAITDDHQIIGWEVCHLYSNNARTFLQSIAACDDFFEKVQLADQIIIEQQPPRNYGMLRQMFYLELFCAQHAPTCLVHAQTKNAVWKRHLPSFVHPRTYSARKKCSIETVTTLLDTGIVSVCMDHNPFEDAKKKDDLSDCLCQALGYSRLS